MAAHSSHLKMPMLASEARAQQQQRRRREEEAKTQQAARMQKEAEKERAVNELAVVDQAEERARLAVTYGFANTRLAVVAAQVKDMDGRIEALEEYAKTLDEQGDADHEMPGIVDQLKKLRASRKLLLKEFVTTTNRKAGV